MSFGLRIKSLALGRLAIHSAEAVDAQLLPGLHQSRVPGFDVLESLFTLGIGGLGDDLPSLVLHQICLAMPRGSLLLRALEDGNLCALATRNLAYGLLLHHLHGTAQKPIQIPRPRLHGGRLLHALHGRLHWNSHAGSRQVEVGRAEGTEG